MTAGISSVEMFDILRHKIGDREAKTLAEYVESEVQRQFENKLSVPATKEDIYAIKAEIKEQKVDLLKWHFGFFLSLSLMILGLYLRK